MKVCTKCELEQDECEFPHRRKKLDGGSYRVSIRSICKKCVNEYNRVYCKTKPNQKIAVKALKLRTREFVKSTKLSKGCVICGYNKSARALHFHHMNPENKNFDICWAAREKMAKYKIQNEIDKCVVLCANCHAEVEDGITIIPVSSS